LNIQIENEEQFESLIDAECEECMKTFERLSLEHNRSNSVRLSDQTSFDQSQTDDTDDGDEEIVIPTNLNSTEIFKKTLGSSSSDDDNDDNDDNDDDDDDTDDDDDNTDTDHSDTDSNTGDESIFEDATEEITSKKYIFNEFSGKLNSNNDIIPTTSKSNNDIRYESDDDNIKKKPLHLMTSFEKLSLVSNIYDSQSLNLSKEKTKTAARVKETLIKNSDKVKTLANSKKKQMLSVKDLIKSKLK
jgi:hypothetical protein